MHTSNSSVFLLLIELALLIGVARVGAEIFKRLGLPAVVGELGAGLLLGPSVFGRVSPTLFAAIFPRQGDQLRLLDVVGTLGMTFLLLLTGLETDVKLVRNLGRAAMMTSAAGMVLPFALGFALGNFMPDAYLADPRHRMLFSLFLATTMSISAMPVIAKILVDLDLTKRNIGLVILSAGVVDDTIGWLVLSMIAGAATHGSVRMGDLGMTMAYLATFLAAAIFVMAPALRWLMRVTVERFKVADSDLVLIVVTTLVCAALTEKIGIHAVFGAFIAGLVLHQVPRLRKEAVARLEAFVMSVLAPVFFGIVGLKVDLGALGGGRMFAVVLVVACMGKLIGCALGAAWGGLRFWEAASLAVAMNARGAMGIVAATIGLGLGILSTQMFSIIVMMAIVTSFMAPIGLRLTMPRVRMTDDEQRRIIAAQAKGQLDPERLRLMIPTGGGPNAALVAPVAFGLAHRSSAAVEVLWIESKTTWRTQLVRWLRRSPEQDADRDLAALKELAPGPLAPQLTKVLAPQVAAGICDEATTRGIDIILLGSNRQGGDIGGALIEEVVANAPCHVAVMRASEPRAVYQRLFVPVDGGVASRLAVEFALRYAENVGAELTLAMLTEKRPQAIAYADISGARPPLESGGEPPADPAREELERISVVFRASSVKPTVITLAYDPLSSAVTREAQTGQYDLVVLGAENRAIQHRLFFGYDNERLIRATKVAVIVVVPNVGRLV